MLKIKLVSGKPHPVYRLRALPYRHLEVVFTNEQIGEVLRALHHYMAAGPSYSDSLILNFDKGEWFFEGKSGILKEGSE